MRNFARVLTLLAALAMAAGVSQAQSLTIDQPLLESATPTTVTGTGSYGNSMVELFVNGSPAGQAQAGPAGNFAIGGVVLNEGDEVFVQQQQSWYFDTPGDFEGWAPTGDLNASVAGGILSGTVTNGAFPAIQNIAATLSGAPTESIKVLEVRMRYASAAPNWNVGVNVVADSGFTAMSVAGKPDFETYVWPLLGNHPNYATGGQLFWLQLAFNFAGAAIGDTVEIDYIRVREYIDYHFDNDGDPMNWVVNLNFPGGITVAGGSLTGVAAGDGGGNPDRIATFTPFAVIDPTVYEVAEVRTTTVGAGLWGGSFAWADNDGVGFPNELAAGGLPGPMIHDLAGTAEWSNNPPVTNTFLWYQGGLMAGETLELDYIRLRPAAYFGPSAKAPVIKLVTDPATVSKDPGDAADFDNIVEAIEWANANPGLNTIRILDSSVYSEDIPIVSDQVIIESVAGETPVIEKSDDSITGNNKTIRWDPATTTGTLTIRGASPTEKLTLRRAFSDKPILQVGSAQHGGNFVLENVILAAPTTGISSEGVFFQANNTSPVLQPNLLTHVEFVGRAATATLPAVQLTAAGGMTVVMTDCDLSQAGGWSAKVNIEGPGSTSITLVNCNLDSNIVNPSANPGDAIAGFILPITGSPSVHLEGCQTLGSSPNNNFYGVFGISGEPRITAVDCDFRLNTLGSRVVNFDGPNTTIDMRNCNLRFGPGAGAASFQGGAQGTYTYSDCVLGGAGGAANQALVVESVADNDGTYVFNDPVLSDGVGFIGVILQEGMSVTLRSTSPSQKLDITPLLDPTNAGTGAVVFGRFGSNGANAGGELILENVTATDSTFFSFIDTFDPLTGNARVVMNGCEWLNGSGTMRMQPGGGAFGFGIEATNTVWADDGTAPAVIDATIALFGSNTAPSSISLTHCTLFSTVQGQGMLRFFDNGGSGRVDTLTAEYCIFIDSDAAAVSGDFGTGNGNLSGSANLFTEEGSVAPGGFFGGEPAGFGTRTSSAALALDANGRITAQGSPAVDAAAGSTTSFDIDGQARPIGFAADTGADESPFEPVNNARTWHLY